MPLCFADPSQDADSLDLTSREQLSIDLTSQPLSVGQLLTVKATGDKVDSFQVKLRLNTEVEIDIRLT